jgi:hypothetical protein
VWGLEVWIFYAQLTQRSSHNHSKKQLYLIEASANNDNADSAIATE